MQHHNLRFVEDRYEIKEAEKQWQGDERENRYPNYRLVYTLI
jgi:hypothetical protein